MKRILVLASSVALILSGCNKVDHLKTGSSNISSTVSFETYLGRNTKGLEKTTFKMGDQFFTYGVKTDADFDVTSPAFTEYVFVGAAPLDHSATLSHIGFDALGQPIWSYDEVAPWDDKKATFFAVSPVPQGAETYGVTINPVANNAIPTIDFEVRGGYDPLIATPQDILNASEQIKSQPDLMWAFSPNNIKTGGAIQMQFNHALSQLTFAVKAYHTTGLLRINSITLKSVMTEGTLALAHDETAKGQINYLGGWNTATTPLSFAVNLLTEKVTAIDPFIPLPGNTEPPMINITDDDEALMMIPQKLDGVGLEVRYSYSLDGIEWRDYESGTALDYELGKLSTHWNPNMRYNYTLNINPGKAITFKADIDEWDPTNGTVDMEYRTFDILSNAGSLANKSDGTAELFALNQDDKITVVYDPVPAAGAEWLLYTTAAGGSTAQKLSSAITVAAGDAGGWRLAANWNDNAAIRKAVITIERAPYDKIVNGTTVQVKSGVAKYIVVQAGGKALTPTSVVYGGQSGTIVTGFNGFTITGYNNALGAPAFATETDVLAANGELPYRRFRVATANAATAGDLNAAVTACANYTEAGQSAGTKWRLPRAAELKLLILNKTAINAALTNKLNAKYWSATLQDDLTEMYWLGDFAGNVISAMGKTDATVLTRCVAEE